MKKMLLAALSALLSLSAWAQTVTFAPVEGVSDAVREVVEQRFAQMLRSGGVTLGEGACTLQVTVETVDRMETPGSISQTALAVEVRAVLRKDGEAVVENVWQVKGVGADEEDALLRAVKQILPRSKASQAFVEEVKRAV